VVVGLAPGVLELERQAAGLEAQRALVGRVRVDVLEGQVDGRENWRALIRPL